MPIYNINNLVDMALLIFFLGIYFYTLISAASIFYHFRFFGMRGEIGGKIIELWFVIINLLIFLINTSLLVLIFTKI